ncbi:MAG: hypothetical protein AAFR83_09105 [Cyanobacteria bacterium J06629_18]
MLKKVKFAALGLIAASAILPVAPVNAALSATNQESITEIQTTPGEQLVAGRYRRYRRIRVHRRRPRRRYRRVYRRRYRRPVRIYRRRTCYYSRRRNRRVCKYRTYRRY